MTVGNYLLYSLLCICVVFFALLLLMAIIKIMTALNLSDEPKKAKQAAAPAPTTTEIAVVEAELAPGSAGDIKLYGTDPRDAAMIMAIVADELQKPINELRFISIREITPAEK